MATLRKPGYGSLSQADCDFTHNEQGFGALDATDDEKNALIKDDDRPKSNESSLSPRSITPSRDNGNLSRRISSHSGLPTVVCPTCSGKGKLSQAQSDTMLALIPMHDQRLKPKRTKLKLAVAFALLVIIGGMCFGFLFPRTVAISITSANIKNISQFTNTRVKIEMMAQTCLNNTNFFAVDLTKVNVEVLFLDTKDLTAHEVGNTVINQTIHLALRKISKRSFDVRTQYTGTDAKIVKRVCLDYKQYFLIKILLTVTVKYWLHSEQISASKFYYIDCGNSTATHLKPP